MDYYNRRYRPDVVVGDEKRESNMACVRASEDGYLDRPYIPMLGSEVSLVYTSRDRFELELRLNGVSKLCKTKEWEF